MNLTDYVLIPSVFFRDVGWLILVVVVREWAIEKRVRTVATLLTAMACYVTLELWLHAAAEQALAVYWGG